VQAIRTDQTPLRQVYDPGHPAANAQGYVEYSNVEPVKEMVDMLSATRAYEANITAFNAARNMARSALSIGQR
jgi:flagellar basal-body rod protein FlgC